MSTRSGRQAGCLDTHSAINLVRDGLELGERLEVARPPRGAFDSDQHRQVEAEHVAVEDAHGMRVRAQLIEAAAAGDLSEQVDVPEGGRQREVEASREGVVIPVERQSARRASEIWLEGAKGRHDSREIVGPSE